MENVKKFFVYILRAPDNSLYTGQTNNLSRRLKEHAQKGSKSTKYLSKYSGFKLVYQEKYATRSEAMRREYEIKSWTKDKKESLIHNNPL